MWKKPTFFVDDIVRRKWKCEKRAMPPQIREGAREKKKQIGRTVVRISTAVIHNRRAETHKKTQQKSREYFEKQTKGRKKPTQNFFCFFCRGMV